MDALKRQQSDLEDQARLVKQEVERLDRSLKNEHSALGGVKAEVQVCMANSLQLYC